MVCIHVLSLHFMARQIPILIQLASVHKHKIIEHYENVAKIKRFLFILSCNYVYAQTIF